MSANPIAALPIPGEDPTSVTVIIPVRDGATTICQQLRLLADERLSVPWSVLVVDNGSTDATVAIVEAQAGHFAQLTVLDARQRRGPAHARNAGAAAAPGDLLCFCDADDEIEPGWLSALVAVAVGNHFVAGRMAIETINSPTVRSWRPRPVTAGTSAPPFAPSGNFAIWADVFSMVGGFDEDLRANEDVELSQRLLAAGARMGWAPEAVIHYRFRTSLWALTRQSFRSGWYAEATSLLPGGAQPGSGSLSVASVGRTVAWLLVRMPYIALAGRRGLWLSRLGNLTGEVTAVTWLRGKDRWARWRSPSAPPTRGGEPP